MPEARVLEGIAKRLPELLELGLLDVLGIGLAAAMIAALIARAGRNLKRLAELEPAA